MANGPAAVAPSSAAEELAFRARLLNQVPGMVGYWDRELRNRYANQAYVEWFGQTPDAILGKHIREVIGEELFALNEPYMRAALAGNPQLFEREIPDPTGRKRRSQARYIPDAPNGTVEGFFVLVTDISELRAAQDALEQSRNALEERVAERTRELATANAELLAEVDARRRAQAALLDTEEQLRQSQKMEAIGVLAGGIAHDFNNLLSVIMASAELLRDRLPAREGTRDELDEILYASERASGLTHQLLAFSRKQFLSPRIIDVNQAILDLGKMIQRILGEDIELALITHAERSRVSVDPGQLEQALMNLVVNARDAMRDGGKLTIETATVDVDQEYVATHPEVRVGPHVMIAVSDTGEGMDRATQAKIFEPFFTTKPKGRGTGLGLSTVFGIVKQSAGSIFVYSELGRGTVFKLYFPLSSQSEQPVRQPTPVTTEARRAVILLVEDDDAVRAVMRTVLCRGGHTVFDAANGAAALARVAQDHAHIDLLVTDVVMPHLNGRQLATRLLQLRPGLKVLFISGYTENAIVHHGVLDENIHFLAKPIVPKSLLEKVQQVLIAE
jgi:PAS domain S-box-containing protein